MRSICPNIQINLKTLRFALFTLIISFSGCCYAQKQGHVWYFGEGLGLDFNQSPPKILTDGQIDRFLQNNVWWNEGCTSLSNGKGELFFYSNGEKVWNRKHEVMLNGSGLMGNHSSTNAALAVPLPGTNALYYLFTTDDWQSGLPNGLRYSVIDMCGDGGYGEVLQSSKNTLLLNPSGERLAFTKHTNGVDFWLVAHEHFSTAFHAYLITEQGIAKEVISVVGTYHGRDDTRDAIGQMKISPDGSRLALVLENRSPAVIDLFDFDPSSGKVSNYINLSSGEKTGLYGLAFSPDNTKLYVNSGLGLCQYSLDAFDGSAASIRQTKYTLPETIRYGSGLQLTPTGQVYVIRTDYIGVIHEPNLPGAACDYLYNAIDLRGKSSIYSFPAFLDSFDYPNKDSSVPNPDLETGLSLCPGQNVLLDATVDDAGASYLWQDGSGQPLYTVSSPGLYWVEVSNEFCSIRKNISALEVTIKSLGPDTTACTGDVFLLDATTPEGQYAWQDGSDKPAFEVVSTGTYWVDVTKKGCILRDSIYIAFFLRPDFTLGKDTTLCEGEELSLVIDAGADHYVWQDGSVNRRYTVTRAGHYTATANVRGCSYTDDINVNYVLLRAVAFGADTLLCSGSTLTLSVGAGNGIPRWNDGSTGNSQVVRDSGLYWTVVSLGNCLKADTIQVDFTECVLELPNVFSPNQDQYNPRFMPMEMSGILSARMTVYNRWGNEIYHTDNLVTGWDGNSSGSLASSGVYFWNVQYIDIAHQTHTLKGTVTVCR